MASAASGVVTPAGRPGRPGKPKVKVKAKGKKVVVTWAAASSNGSPVVGYLVRVSKGANASTSGRRKVVLRGLGKGRHQVKVFAVNAVGRSQAGPATTLKLKR